MMDTNGLYGKYRVERVDGQPVGRCFVLEPETDYAAQLALETYSYHCQRQLGKELSVWLDKIKAAWLEKLKAKYKMLDEYAARLAINPVCPICGAHAHRWAMMDEGWTLGWECESNAGCLEEVEIAWPFGDEEKSDEELVALGYEII